MDAIDLEEARQDIPGATHTELMTMAYELVARAEKSEALAKEQERVIERLEDIVRNMTSAHEFKAPPMGSWAKFTSECFCPGCLYLYGEDRPSPQATPKPSKVLHGMDLAHAEAVAENGHRENHAGYGCTFCGSFWNPTGWGSEWHKPGCAKVEPQAAAGKECECGGKFRPDIMGETCVFCGAPRPDAPEAGT